ncbi:nucleus protein [Rhizoctonia solani AG-1 IA]|uniref:Nucleus protein n=1 Tax=Thanatephorus cucumeris (strain AG1-IA) TaxID=983506 RepID=L8X6G9_THACA|nr:nucleus protein [Rhizoctonia solani AG-1 IA]
MRRVKVRLFSLSRPSLTPSPLPGIRAQGHYDDTTEKAVILVKSEFTDVELLRCEIQAQDVYQRQQETLIVWTEPNGTDFALSFQDLDGCGEIWDFIQEVQRHLREDPTSSSPPSTPKVSLERRFAQSFMQAGQIPPPEFNNIGDIDRAIKFLSKNPALKEKICETLVYQAERSESLQHLHTLCRIMQTINDPEFPDHKASYRHFLSYVAHYREAVPIRDSVVRKKIHQTYRLLFLKDVVLARMLDDPTFNILNSFIIFNQMDIVTHFQHEETILPRMFSAFPRLFTKDGKSSLETHEDPTNIPSDFQPQLNGAGNSSPVIGPMPSPDYSAISSDQDTRRKDIIRMTHQLCSTAKNVQVTTRFALYRLLVDRGVLYAIQWAFSVHNPNPDMVSVQHLCGDILLSVMEYDPHGVRQNILQHSEAGVRTLLEQMIATMGSTKDLALRSQISDALRVLLEVQGAGGDMSVGEVSHFTSIAHRLLMTYSDLVFLPLPRPQWADEKIQRRNDSCNTFTSSALFRFISPFWPSRTLRPCKAVPRVSGAALNAPKEHMAQFLFLCDLLSNFVVQHGHRCQFYICASNIALKLASLLSSREKHVRLGTPALRVFRACFRTPNQFVTRHLIKQDVVLPIIELTARESRRDNMLSSTCQEFFEYIRRVSAWPGVCVCVTCDQLHKHEARVRELAKHPMVGMRFAGIILRWEQNHEEPPSTESVANSTNGNSTRRWGSGRHMDSEEEDYFNGADDETTEVPLKWAPVQVPPVNQLKRKRARVALGAGARGRAGSDGSGSTAVFQPIKPPSAGLLGLSGYEDEGEGEEEDEDMNANADGTLGFQNVLSPSPMSVDPDRGSACRYAVGLCR